MKMNTIFNQKVDRSDLIFFLGLNLLENSWRVGDSVKVGNAVRMKFLTSK